MDLLYVPPETVDNLLAITNIVTTIKSRLELKKAGANYQACCPFHHEKTASFTVSETKQFYHCFGCGASGSVIGFVMEYDGIPFVEAIQELAEDAGMDLSHLEADKNDMRFKLAALNNKVATDYQSNLKVKGNLGADYLASRGISAKTIEKFAVGVSKDSWTDLLDRRGQDKDTYDKLLHLSLIKKNTDKNSVYDTFRNRLMFPIRGASGDTVGFGARTMTEELPKYLNSSESDIFQKRDTLYGLYENKHGLRAQNKALIVEGYMDVVGLAEHGVDIAVAALGTAVTGRQLNYLARYVDAFIFCLDGDKAGRKAAIKALRTSLAMLKDTLSVSFIFLPEGEDPDSFILRQGKASFDNLVDNAIPLSELFFDEMTKDYDLDNVESRVAMVKKATAELNTIHYAPSFKRIMESELASKVGMDVDFIQAQAAQVEKNKPSLAPQVKPVMMTPTRKAISIALQYPEMVLHADADLYYIEKLEERGAKLLVEIMNTLSQMEDLDRLSSATVIERFRGKDQTVFDSIAKLANAEIGTAEILEKEWGIIIANLNTEGKQFYVTQLASKPFDEFSDEDKAAFTALT